MTMSLPLIEMTGASVPARERRGEAVLEAVTWMVRAGERWIVCGPQASGKSNLLLTAAGLLRPLKGSHRLFGRDPAHLNEEELVRDRLRVGFVFGNDGRLFHQMTVSENVAFPLCYHKNCRGAEVGERVQAVLEATGLKAHAASRPGSLNRSIRLKVGLARALVLDPELILLDEPLNGEGPRETAWWLGFLERLQAGRVVPGGRPVSVVVSANDVRPWVGDHGGKVALVYQRQFRHVCESADLGPKAEALMEEWFTDGK